MARRRGLFNTGSNLIQMYIQDQLLRGRQAEQEQAITARQQGMDRYNFAQTLLPKIADGTYPLEGLSPQTRGDIGQFYDPEKMAPSLNQRLAKILGQPKLPQDVPSNELLGGLLGEQEGLPQDLTSLVDAERNRVARFEPTTNVEYYTEKGDKVSQHFPDSMLDELGAMKQERTPQQEGQRTLGIAQSGELSPGMMIAKSQFENGMNQATMGSEAAKAGRVAGAESSARYGAEFAPNVVDSRVDQARRMAEATAQGTAAGNPASSSGVLSEGERKATAALPTLIRAHGMAIDMENKGMSLSPTSIVAAGPSLIGKVARNFVESPVQQYAQTGIEYINLASNIFSGTTVREDEYPRFLSNMFVMDNDPPELVKQKQQSRAGFVQAQQVAAGRGAAAGGQALGMQIINGVINPAIATSLQFSDPEFEEAFMETIAPVFNIIREDGKLMLERR